MGSKLSIEDRLAAKHFSPEQHPSQIEPDYEIVERQRVELVGEQIEGEALQIAEEQDFDFIAQQMEGDASNPFPKYTASQIRSLNCSSDNPTCIDFRNHKGKWVPARIEQCRADQFLVHLKSNRRILQGRKSVQREGHCENERQHGRQKRNGKQDIYIWVNLGDSYRCAEFRTLTSNPAEDSDVKQNVLRRNDIVMIKPPKYIMQGRMASSIAESVEWCRSGWVHGTIKRISGYFIRVAFRGTFCWFHCHDTSEVRSLVASRKKL